MSSTSVETLYADALNLAKNRSATPNNLEYVAKATSGEAARWAFTQWSLRERASSKFFRAEEMLFDRDGLEMATHEGLAQYHASLFPEGALVHDLTAGIGADLIALARRGPAVGFDVDPSRAEMARHNLEVHGLQAQVLTDSWEALEGAQYFFLDPARRSGGKRTLDPSSFEPDPISVLARFPDARLGIVKLSPMLPDTFLKSLARRLEFVSFRGECREVLASVGRDAERGRCATLPEVGEVLNSVSGSGLAVEEPAKYLYEADPAAIRANCLPELCRMHGLAQLGDSNGYLTGESPQSSPWLKAFSVLSWSRFDVGDLKRELVALGSASPILKQRGGGQDLEKLRKSLMLNGSRQLSAAIFPVGKSLRFAILEPVR